MYDDVSFREPSTISAQRALSLPRSVLRAGLGKLLGLKRLCFFESEESTRLTSCDVDSKTKGF